MTISFSDGGPTPRADLREITVAPFAEARLAAAKRAFTTRRVPDESLRCLLSGPVRPRPGNLVLARVERLGQHRKLELTTGRRATLHVGDEIVVAYANRYAPDQYEAHVPVDLRPTQLVASGGVASAVLSRSREVRAATDIVPLGLVGDERGLPVDVADFALATPTPPMRRPPTLAVIGASMNSGKTTTIHRIVRGLVRAGHRPGVTKVTGTGSGNDFWIMADAGAHAVVDFTDAGLASTYREDMAVVERVMVALTDHLAHSGCRSMLVEVADGALQRETAKLITAPSFLERIDGVVFAAPDALSAIGGVGHLRGLGLDVVAVAGRITRSPLAMREAAAAIDVPILTLEELEDVQVASDLLGLPVHPGTPTLDDLVPAHELDELEEAEDVEDVEEVIDLRRTGAEQGTAPTRRTPGAGLPRLRLHGRTV